MNFLKNILKAPLKTGFLNKKVRLCPIVKPHIDFFFDSVTIFTYEACICKTDLRQFKEL